MEHPDKIAYTFQCCYDNRVNSTIDHILVKEALKDYISNYDTVDSIDNFSDHVAVKCEINLQVDSFKKVYQINIRYCKIQKFTF